MIELTLKDEDLFTSSGGDCKPRSYTGSSLTSSPLEALFKTPLRSYFVISLDNIRVKLPGRKKFESPAIFLLDRKTDIKLVCIREEQGIYTKYTLYSYTNNQIKD